MGEVPRHFPPARLDIMGEFPHVRKKALGKEMKADEAVKFLASLAREQEAIAAPYESASDPEAAADFREMAKILRMIAGGEGGAEELERSRALIAREIEILDRKETANPGDQKRRGERWRNLYRLRDFLDKKAE